MFSLHRFTTDGIITHMSDIEKNSTPSNPESGYLNSLPALLQQPDFSGNIPRDADCVALWKKYCMFDNVCAHSQAVADFATGLAERAVECGLPVNVPAVRASAMLHDIAKTYSIKYGGSHAQIGASWVIAETRNRAIAQGVMLHVFWPWAVSKSIISSLPFFVIYADKRIRHDTCVTLSERFEDLLVRYGKDEKSRNNIRKSYKQGLEIETALSAQLGWKLDAYSLDSGRLVQRT